MFGKVFFPAYSIHFDICTTQKVELLFSHIAPSRCSLLDNTANPSCSIHAHNAWSIDRHLPCIRTVLVTYLDLEQFDCQCIPIHFLCFPTLISLIQILCPFYILCVFMVEAPGTAPGSCPALNLLQHCVIFIAYYNYKVNK